MRIGLFFGSFNPVHVGHMIIANFMVQNAAIDQLWMVLSPQNPFKERDTLANDYDRLHLLNLAIGDHPKIRSSKVEFSLPQPSYTIDTLTYLKEKYPNDQFSLIMGGDNLASFHKWKNYEQILEHHDIYIYKRSTHSDNPLEGNERVIVCEAPMLNISASYIRKLIQEEKSIQYLVPDAVYHYLKDSRIYKDLA
jgi:nicotinate-nucleotide adenylyltransferase